MRTRLEMSEGGFLMTIHNMMEVARDKLYLWRISACVAPAGAVTLAQTLEAERKNGNTEAYQVKIY